MKGKSSKLSLTLLNIAIFPMVVLTLIIIVVGSSFVTHSLNLKVKDAIIDISNMTIASLNAQYPGDFEGVDQDGELYLLKGEHMMNNDFAYIDSVKAASGCDVTLYYMQYAVITTITDEQGNRLIGSGISQVVIDDVLKTGNSKFYDNAYISDKPYYAYFTPIKNSDGDIIAVLSVSEPSEIVKGLVRKAIIPILLVGFSACILIVLIVLRYSRGFVVTIKKMQGYMNALAGGNFSAELDPRIQSRTDEIGQMGKSAVKMAASLRKRVEEDLLTGLLNRRSGERKTRNTLESYIYKGVRFCVAIGDIDFFKKVNDTYGHEAGDLVLMAVASTLKNFMVAKGYVIRWGGEEFLMIYEDAEADKVCGYIEELLDKIRALEIKDGDTLIKVTMTMGLVECNPEDKKKLVEELENAESEKDKEQIIKTRMDKYIDAADSKLYYGKEHGRNQYVYMIEESSDNND